MFNSPHTEVIGYYRTLSPQQSQCNTVSDTGVCPDLALTDFTWLRMVPKSLSNQRVIWGTDTTHCSFEFICVFFSPQALTGHEWTEPVVDKAGVGKDFRFIYFILLLFFNSSALSRADVMKQLKGVKELCLLVLSRLNSPCLVIVTVGLFLTHSMNCPS